MELTCFYSVQIHCNLAVTFIVGLMCFREMDTPMVCKFTAFYLHYNFFM